jgi:hypothetical protein
MVGTTEDKHSKDNLRDATLDDIIETVAENLYGKLETGFNSEFNVDKTFMYYFYITGIKYSKNNIFPSFDDDVAREFKDFVNIILLQKNREKPIIPEETCRFIKQSVEYLWDERFQKIPTEFKGEYIKKESLNRLLKIIKDNNLDRNLEQERKKFYEENNKRPREDNDNFQETVKRTRTDSRDGFYR